MFQECGCEYACEFGYRMRLNTPITVLRTHIQDWHPYSAVVCEHGLKAACVTDTYIVKCSLAAVTWKDTIYTVDLDSPWASISQHTALILLLQQQQIFNCQQQHWLILMTNTKNLKDSQVSYYTSHVLKHPKTLLFTRHLVQNSGGFKRQRPL